MCWIHRSIWPNSHTNAGAVLDHYTAPHIVISPHDCRLIYHGRLSHLHLATPFFLHISGFLVLALSRSRQICTVPLEFFGLSLFAGRMSKLRSFITNASNSKVRDARFSTQAGRGLAGTIRNVSSMNSKTEISTLTNTSFHKLDIPNDDLQVVQAPKQPYSWLQDLDSQICRSPKLTPPKPKERPFDRLINNITSYLASSPLSSRHPKISQLDSFLHDYSSDPSEWSKYAHPNPSKQYTRNFVCGIPGIFNLLILVWTPGRKSPVHDHADAHCLMKVGFL